MKLTPDQQRALEQLETTTDYEVGEAALRVLQSVEDRASDYVWIGIAIAVVGGLLLMFQVAFEVVHALFLAGMASIALWRFATRNSVRARIAAADNRWRQLAGTLAVRRNLTSNEAEQ